MTKISIQEIINHEKTMSRQSEWSLLSVFVPRPVKPKMDREKLNVLG